VAAGACKDGVIRGVSVASGANPIGIAMVDGEESVVAGGQGRREPCGRGVACSAGSRPARGDVIWVSSSSEVCLVAGVAGGRRPRKYIIDVALDAVHSGVCACQREWRVVVVERCPGPCGRRVAGTAGGWEARSGVCGVCCSIPVSRVAAVAGRGQSGVVVIDVA
jgi:hypothetical protein